MNRERFLAIGIVALVVLTATAALLVPGAIATPSIDEDRGRDVLDVRELAISHGTVGGERVPLRVEARLFHGGAPSENVTVRFRAVDLASGLVQTTTTVDVGTLTERREVPVEATLTVPRKGDYRLETVVFGASNRRAVGEKAVRGVGALQPAYADTNVTFHEFGTGTGVALPAIEYAIEDAAGNRSVLAVETFLTNRGGTPAEGYRVVLKARQVDSNIVAAEQSVQVGRIDPGRTASAETTLRVPENYNYYLDAVLWRDGVVVDTTRSAARLDPTETVHVNETRREVGLEVGDFEQQEGGASERPDQRPATTTVSAGGPGFGVTAGLLAFLAALVLAFHRGDPRE